MKPLWLSLVMIITLTGCSSHPKIETWLSRTAVSPIPFVKASFDITIQKERESEHVSAVALCVPYTKYRLEFYGPLGVHGGSFLWTDSAWSLYIPKKQTLIKGIGETIRFLSIDNVNIHVTSEIFWGALLPKGWCTAESVDVKDLRTLTWQREQYRYTAHINLESGEVTDLSIQDDTGTTRITYLEYKLFEPYTLPSLITQELPDGTSIKIHLSTLDFNAPDKEKYWRLKLPATIETIYAQ